jgi:hypothetical protein
VADQQFSFVADSLGNQIPIVAVSGGIRVASLKADLNFDHAVDGDDYLIWQQGFGIKGVHSADANSDGVVDAADYVVWRDNYGAKPFPSDYDFDGNVNGKDLFVWQKAFGSGTELYADGNKNQIVDAADYTIWRDHSPLQHLIGDYDLDGDVDGGDLIVWRRDFGSTSVLAADGNSNGIVDAADYVIWRDGIGRRLVQDHVASALNIPEPESLVTFSLIVVSYSLYRYRRGNCQLKALT